jgi:hypothetical protein
MACRERQRWPLSDSPLYWKNSRKFADSFRELLREIDEKRDRFLKEREYGGIEGESS